MISLMKKTSKMSSTSMLNGKLRWMVMSPSEFKAHLPVGATLLKNSAIRVSMTLHGMITSCRQTIPSVGQLQITKIGRKCTSRKCHGLIPQAAGATNSKEVSISNHLAQFKTEVNGTKVLRHSILQIELLLALQIRLSLTSPIPTQLMMMVI